MSKLTGTIASVNMTTNLILQRPSTTVVLAMSTDGKIADVKRSPARFASEADQAHLERQVALADGVLFGAGTLRAYGTTMSVSTPQLLEQRQQQGKPSQPVQIVCSASAKIDPELRFFRQSVPRWLLTTTTGAEYWQKQAKETFFERILVSNATVGVINWTEALQQLATLGLKRVAVLGGGTLVAALLASDLIDEFWLTVCPLVLGGTSAPTPVEGSGFLEHQARRLQLLSAQTVGQEVFLHYRLQPR
jgi:5-amino-6-(5-phosphoribosylamino)uracil reductase